MNTKTVVAVAAAILAVGQAVAAAYEIGEEFASESFWRSDPALFVIRHSDNGFSFTSDQRDGADSRMEGGVTCFGAQVYETRVSFGAAGGVERVEVMLYTRGGTESLNEFVGAGGKKFKRLERVDKTISRDEFMDVLEKVRKRLTPAGAKPPPVTKESVGTQSARQRSQVWPRTALPTQATLTWSFEQSGRSVETFRAGFIRLAVDGPLRLAAASGRDDRKGKKPAAKGAKKIVDNVIDESKGRGDVFVDGVPMVDQGQKGYCAAASAERVLRYYGLEIDEHQVAEAAGTTAEKGTSALDMKNAVESIGKRFRLGTVVCYGEFDKGVEARIAGLEDEVRSYNKAAKKLKKPAIGEDVYLERHGNSLSYNPVAVDRAMDPEVLKEMKTNGAHKAKFKKFCKDVHEQVHKGVPLFWSVKLGVYPEPGLLQEGGYHMRLIIGFNDKKGELLYSDSWGAGHEVKRMPIEWAWTITRCLMYMKPLTR